jgi:hypothetical protein
MNQADVSEIPPHLNTVQKKHRGNGRKGIKER